MNKGKIDGPLGKRVAMDYRMIFPLSNTQRLLLRHLPTFTPKKLFKPSKEGLGDLEGISLRCWNVEVLFWEPNQYESKICRNLFKKIGLEGVTCVHYEYIHEIEGRRYEKVFTNRMGWGFYFGTKVSMVVERTNKIKYFKRFGKGVNLDI